MFRVFVNLLLMTAQNDPVIHTKCRELYRPDSGIGRLNIGPQVFLKKFSSRLLILLISKNLLVRHGR